MIRVGTVAAENFQKLERGVNVPQIGDVFECLGSFQQNRGKKNGKCRVFGAVDVNFPVERSAAFNNQFVHKNILGCVSGTGWLTKGPLLAGAWFFSGILARTEKIQKLIRMV